MRLKGAFVSKFNEALYASRATTVGMSESHGATHRQVEEFMERMKYELTEVLLAPAMHEMNGKYRSRRADAAEAKNS